LKQLTRSYYFTWTEVAPYTGAWIETVLVYSSTWKFFVAPYTGAWIETSH